MATDGAEEGGLEFGIIEKGRDICESYRIRGSLVSPERTFICNVHAEVGGGQENLEICEQNSTLSGSFHCVNGISC